MWCVLDSVAKCIRSDVLFVCWPSWMSARTQIRTDFPWFAGFLLSYPAVNKTLVCGAVLGALNCMHVCGHTLDLIVTRQTDLIIGSTPRVDYLFSDHMPVLCQLRLDKASLEKSHVSYRKIKSVDLDVLREELSNSYLCENMYSL